MTSCNSTPLVLPLRVLAVLLPLRVLAVLLPPLLLLLLLLLFFRSSNVFLSAFRRTFFHHTCILFAAFNLLFRSVNRCLGVLDGEFNRDCDVEVRI
jgi:hypothetical protein